MRVGETNQQMEEELTKCCTPNTMEREKAERQWHRPGASGRALPALNLHFSPKKSQATPLLKHYKSHNPMPYPTSDSQS
ncbi:uncharacterized [Tachysurus ichikawai]